METKKKFIIMCAFVWASFWGSLYGQIGSDFVLVPGGQEPSVALDRNSNIHLAWWSKGDIYYALFDSMGNQMRAPQKLTNSNIVTGHINREPQMAVIADYAVVVWTDIFSTATNNICGQLFTINGDTVFDKIRFNEYGFESVNPDVTFINDSTFFTVWVGDQTGIPFPLTGVYGQIMTISLSRIGSNEILNDDTPDNFTRSISRIASHPNSENVVVVWREELSSDSEKVFGRLFLKSGLPKHSTFLIGEDPDTLEVWSPSVVMNKSGEFIIVWSSGRSNMDWNVNLRRFNTDGTAFGPSKKINEGPALHAASADISMDFDGRFVVVWEGQGRTGSNIIAQRFTANTTPIGNNFKVAASTDTLEQYSPSVELQNGKIYTVWRNDGPIWANIIDFNNPPTHVENKKFDTPKNFQLYQNYPNPFNPSTTIKYEISQRSKVRIVIYNVLGEEIITLMDKEVMSGIYEVQWNGKDFNGGDVSTGIYFYRLSVGDGFTKIRKMVLVR